MICVSLVRFGGSSLSLRDALALNMKHIIAILSIIGTIAMFAICLICMVYSLIGRKGQWEKPNEDRKTK